METKLVKAKNGKYHIRLTYYNQEGILQRKRLFLRKIATAGLMAMALAVTAGTTTIKLAQEISYKLEENRIENLRENAKKIANSENDIVKVNGIETKISDEINKFAEKREILNNAKHENKEASDMLMNSIEESEDAITSATFYTIKDEASEFFEDKENTNLEIYGTGKFGEPQRFIRQIDTKTTRLNPNNTVIDEKLVDSSLVDAIVDGDSIDYLIDQYANFNGFEETLDGELKQRK